MASWGFSRVTQDEIPSVEQPVKSHECDWALVPIVANEGLTFVICRLTLSNTQGQERLRQEYMTCWVANLFTSMHA